MENCVGAVKFRNGEILYISINEATQTAKRRLFRTPEEVESDDGPVLDLSHIPDEERVTVLPSFMRGKKRQKQGNDSEKFYSRASRSLMAITGPCSIEAYQDELSERASSGTKDSTSTGYICEHLTNAVEQIECIYSKDVQSDVIGLATGFDDIDAVTSGLQPGDLVIVAGRPSMGKTSFTFNVAEHVACESSKTVALFNMEMDGTKLATRLFCASGRIDQHKLRSGNLEDEDWQRMSNALTRLNDSSIYVMDPLAMGWNAAAIGETLFQKGIAPDLIIVDGLQSLDVGSFATAYDRNMQLCEQVRQFKKMALQMKVPVILTSPLGREVETRPNKRPVMRDLRDIGMLEDIADIILFIYRDEMYYPDSADRGVAEIILGKHRNGLPCMVQLTFRGEYCLFENYRAGYASYAR